MLGEEDRSDSAKSFMWVGYGGQPDAPVVYYRYAPSRATSEAATMAGDFSGILQTDGYEAYDRLVRDRGDLTHAGCWAVADVASRFG